MCKLIESNGEYTITEIIVCPRCNNIKLTHKYIIFYTDDKYYCTQENLYSIFVFDFQKQIFNKIVEDCFRYKLEGVFKKKFIKYKSTYNVYGDWIYCIKDGMTVNRRKLSISSHWYRANINMPLKDVDLGENKTLFLL